MAVSPACDHCYAEAQAKRAPRTFGGWGPHAERKRTSESYWRQPLKWNSGARKAGTRPRVFCASMADVFDNAVPVAWRCDLWDLIAETPHLDWLLLTKRPSNIAGMLPQRSHGALTGWGPTGYPNVWLGTTVENQAEADRRIPHLLAVPAARRFLSCEPLLGPLNLRAIDLPGGDSEVLPLGAGYLGRLHDDEAEGRRIDWIIAGGESGPKARPSHPDWFRSLRDQCQAAGVLYFHKQNGEWRPVAPIFGDDPATAAAFVGAREDRCDILTPDGGLWGDGRDEPPGRPVGMNSIRDQVERLGLRMTFEARLRLRQNGAAATHEAVKKRRPPPPVILPAFVPEPVALEALSPDQQAAIADAAMARRQEKARAMLEKKACPHAVASNARLPLREVFRLAGEMRA